MRGHRVRISRLPSARNRRERIPPPQGTTEQAPVPQKAKRPEDPIFGPCAVSRWLRILRRLAAPESETGEPQPEQSKG